MYWDAVYMKNSSAQFLKKIKITRSEIITVENISAK
jgi:hypothetical protein